MESSSVVYDANGHRSQADFRCRFFMIDKSLHSKNRYSRQSANPFVYALRIDADRIPDENSQNSFRNGRSANAISYAAHAASDIFGATSANPCRFSPPTLCERLQIQFCATGGKRGEYAFFRGMFIRFQEMFSPT